MNNPSNIWLHRISHHAEASYPLLENGYLTIGFSDMSDPEFLTRTEDGDGPYFEQRFTSWGTPRSRYNLWKFIYEMAIGDLVVVPSWGTFSVYQIETTATLMSHLVVDGVHAWNGSALVVTENGLHSNEEHLDLGFFRKVTPVAVGISRYDYADSALTSRLKIRNGTANITDLAKNLEKAIFASKENCPINLHSQILASSCSQLLCLLQTELNDAKFEKLIGWYFRQIGASDVRITPKNDPNKEGDADVVAYFEPLKTVYYVQAKYHNGTTNDWAAQQINDYVRHKERLTDGYSKIAWVVSTAPKFSDACQKLAKENSIALFAGPDIARMILEAGIRNLDTAL